MRPGHLRRHGAGPHHYRRAVCDLVAHLLLLATSSSTRSTAQTAYVFSDIFRVRYRALDTSKTGDFLVHGSSHRGTLWWCSTDFTPLYTPQLYLHSCFGYITATRVQAVHELKPSRLVLATKRERSKPNTLRDFCTCRILSVRLQTNQNYFSCRHGRDRHHVFGTAPSIPGLT